ncbi:LCP family protein [Lentibacillus sp. N15]|uniref:LCP family protein n=1 Tax=Lentibacillus songyuanensis TaxID=3136161 RepID=UPI0031BA4224
MHTRRTKKRKTRKWVKKSLLGLGIIISILAVYSVYQYQQGLSSASSVSPEKDSSTIQPFQGEKVHVGEMKILLIGSDARTGEQGRSDTLMIADYNQDTQQVKLASLMRDTYVEIPGYGMQKLNAAYSFGGPELLRQTIKQNFGIDINYYAVVNFEGFPKLIDLLAPNGIEVDIQNEMSTGIGMTLPPGKQTLHGEKLLGYVRFRKDSRSDFGRVERQQEVLSKVREQAVSFTSLARLPKVLGTVNGYVDTNIDSKALFTIGKSLLTKKSSDMETLRIPIKDSYTDERVDVGAVLDIDVETNRQALNTFFSTQGSE